MCSSDLYFATLLSKLYKLTQEQTQLRRAIEASRKAIISSVKLGHATRVAESYWKIAQAQDTLGEHAEAAISFQQASENYVKAAEKIPQLGDFYLDHASYMQAWGEIEEARRSHNQKVHEEAVEHLNKAAKILKGTTRWHQFASNYLAWAKLEEGEALSRREKTEEARDTFQKAADLFIEAKHEIVDKLAATPAGEERKNAEEITMVSDQRREYCLSRVILEDARISAGEGASTASVEKYGVAAGRLEKLMESIEQESDRRELRPIAGLCRAWEKMIQAEQKLSPSLYGEASQIFEQVVEYSPDQQTSLLAQANCYMCKALEEGMRFEVTKTLDLFSAAKKFLDAATTQYLRAGLRNMAEYSRATSKLLDAYLFMYQAQVDVDPLKRAQSFQMAVTMLQTSAGSYIKAQLPAKAEEVQRVLEIVREDREIAVSLSQVMKVPSIASATIGFSAPTQSY